jgi:hypothetical protein
MSSPTIGLPWDGRVGPARGLLGRSVALAVAVTVAVTAWFMAATAARHDYDPTTWIVAGTDFAATSRVPADAVRLRGSGYDGQFYYALARDPLALDPATRAAIDTPAYRAQRVLLPALAWAASGGGSTGALEWAIPALNLAGAALLALAVALIARGRGAPAWFGVGAGLLLGVLLAALRDLTEPLALAALALAILARERSRPAAWGALAAAACLGRESLAIAVAAILLVDLVQRRWPLAAAGAAALAAAAGWQLWLRAHLGTAGVMSGGPDTFSAPLEGPLHHIRVLDRLDLLTHRSGLWALAFMALTALACAWGVAAALRDRDDIAAAFVALLVLFALSGPPVWADVFGFARAAAPVWLMLVVMAARRPWRAAAAWIPALSVALTLAFCLVGGIPRLL